MNNAKWLSMLGLARRAGKLAMGHDLALQSVRDGKAQLVLTARNVSPRLSLRPPVKSVPKPPACVPCPAP